MPVSQAYKIFSGQFLRLLVSCIRQSRFVRTDHQDDSSLIQSHTPPWSLEQIHQTRSNPSAKKSTRSTKL